jgi:Legionella pneumophila major outer membrane protein precursor
MEQIFRYSAAMSLALIAATLVPRTADAAGRKRQLYEPPQPQQPASSTTGTFVSVEGGLACLYGDGAGIASGEKPFDTDPNPAPAVARTVDDNCGWTGRAGFGQDRTNLFGGVFDSWAVYGRHSEFASQRLRATGALYDDGDLQFQNAFTGSADSRRTVIDLEAGKNLGVGTGVRVFMGLRYAHFEEKAALNGTLFARDLLTGDAGILNGFQARISNTFDGAGPRIGFASRARFPTGGWGVMISGSASALYGEQEQTITATHGDPDTSSSTVTSRSTRSDWVFNVEGEAALTLQTAIKGEFALGARAEAWYGETQPGQAGRSCVSNAIAEGCTAYTKGDSFNWGPFARWKIYLD